jgi:prepilin-type N-terminal cleavage/methylation domain-containing protein
MTHSLLHQSEGSLRKSSSRCAFTLVEVMVAVFVMAIGLTSTAVCMQVGMQMHDDARSISYVTEVLQDQAEQIRLLNWTAIEKLPDTETFTAPDYFAVNSVNQSRFTFTRSVSDVPDQTEIKNITLNATWKSLKGAQKTRTLLLRYANNGLYDYNYGISQ